MKKIIFLLLVLTSCYPVPNGIGQSGRPVPNKVMSNHAPADYPGTPVYNANQCIGTVINGVCDGEVMGIFPARCYGEMLNGKCIGPMF